MRKGQFLKRIKQICKCGNEFEIREKRLLDGRGVYCSKSCKYKYRVRPTGLKYNIVKDNPTQFKIGHKSWNKGTKGIMPTPPNYTGDDVGYSGLHDWISYHYGKAIKCEHCGKTSGRIEWANKSHEYKRHRSDWLQLCKKCHVKYDIQSGNWGLATKKFNLPCRKKKFS